MDQTNTLLINKIKLIYKNEGSDLLTNEEVKHYIQSAAFFENVLQFDKTAILIIEYTNWSYLYCSSNLKDIAGYDAADALKYGPKFTLSHVHTSDLQDQEKAHSLSVEMLTKLPGSEKGKYKFAFTFRHNNPDGRQITILQTNIFLKWDSQGRPLVKLILVSDISAYKQDNNVIFFVSRINEISKNEIVFQKNFTSGENHILSPREIQILRLMAKDLSSETIAQILGISLNTVKNHRKGIIKKLGCKNSTQVVSLARLYGFSSTPSAPKKALQLSLQ